MASAIFILVILLLFASLILWQGFRSNSKSLREMGLGLMGICLLILLALIVS